MRQSVKVGDTDLATYYYTDDRNNYLETLDYGNEGIVNYTYDNKGRLLTQTYEDGDTLSHTYDNSGNLATVTDSATGRKTTYYYDLTDRLMKTVETGTDYLHSVEYTYDAKNNLTQQVENINGTKRTVSYSYDKDNRVTDVSDGTVSVHYTYDSYGRVSKKETKNNGTNIKTEEYTFQDLRPNDIYTSDVISTYKLTIRDEQVVTYSYTYDNNGNILTVSDGTNTISYTYDSANQLVQEQNSQTGTHSWSYDNAGNITAADNVVYSYGNEEWKDLLTAYNGQAIRYDQIGNPEFDGIWNYTWEHGRQLASMSDGSTTWSYTYDADGLRTGRTNGTDTYSYVYNGGSLSKLTKGSDTLYFTYDANGTPLTVNYNGTTYYYVTNLQGDVTAIINAAGETVADYQYNAWGNPIAEDGESPSDLETLNPLRYRGYVYDQETGLYYLQSRYYNPEMGRFINADVFASTGQGLQGNNMFAYCGNNPVVRSDYGGTRYCEATTIQGEDVLNRAYSCAWQTQISKSSIAEDSVKIYYAKKKPNMRENRNKRKGSEGRQPSGSRQRNVAHPNGEEHSRVPKGTSRNRGVHRMTGLVGLTTATVCIVWILANDLTGAGVADDGALIPTITIWVDSFNSLFK